MSEKSGMVDVNSYQVGGNHYREIKGEQHWDRAYRLGLDFFQYQITKYVERCWRKNGIEDLRKAQHFLEKYIELKEIKFDPEDPYKVLLNDLLISTEEHAPDLRTIDDVNPFSDLVKDIKEVSAQASGMNDQIRKQHPAVKDFGSERAPDGWIGYTFEGSDAEGDLYRCTHCRTSFHTTLHGNPNKQHQCPEDASAGYVNQG